mgnify:CR=1 FL=1
MFGQAGCLLALFHDELDPGQREILSAFTELPRKSRLGKILLMMRYGFTKIRPSGPLGRCCLWEI